MESGELTQVINFQYDFTDEGFYVHNLYSNPIALNNILVDQGLGCPRIPGIYQVDGSNSTISFVIFPFIFTTYKPPRVDIYSLHFAESGLTQLVCTATGGVPDSHNITLLRSNQDQQLATSTGNELQFYIDNSFFGEFACIVESLYNTKRISLFLLEKASFQLLLSINKRMMCIQLKVNNTFYEDIRRLFNTICDCSVDLEQVKIDCFMTGNMLLSGTVIDSNSKGNRVSASTLIDMLQVWLLTSTDPTLTLQHQHFKLITQCPTRLTSATVDVCRNLTQKFEVAALVANELAAIGGSFIGGVVTGILACLVTLCIGLCVLKLKADMRMRKAGTTSKTSQTTREEEVMMDTNQAYETVEMRYQYTASISQPPVAVDLQEQNTSEEPVYENH